MTTLVAGLFVLQSPLARVVTFDEPAMPLARLLPMLGKAAGIELLPAGSVAKDVALVRAKEKPLGEILKRLAEADGVEIESTKTGYRLVRTVSIERRERALTLARKVSSLSPGLEAMRKSLAVTADTPAYRALVPALRAKSGAGGWTRSGAMGGSVQPPATRAAMRALLQIPVETLASLREGDRIVYSNRPTQLQTRMAGLEEVMKSFEREQNAWADANARGEKVPPTNSAENPFRHVERLDGPPSRAVLIVSRGNSADAAVARIVLLDSQGAEVGMALVGLQSKEDASAMAQLTTPTRSRPVRISPETKTLLDGAPGVNGSGPETASPEAAALLGDPEHHDPLSFGATDLVRDLGGEGSIVAVLPDVVWLIGFVGEKNEVQRGDRALLETAVELRNEEGWLVARPRDPEAARQARVDRTVLGRFVRSIIVSKRVPLDELAAYAWNGSDAPSDVVGLFAAMMIARPLMGNIYEWRLLRLYGSLSSYDRAALLAGGKKDWRTLSPRQRELAAYVASHRVGSFSGGSFKPNASIVLMMEPTEIFADRFGALTISLQSQEDAPLVCDSTTDQKARRWQRILDPESAGRTVGMKDGPQFDRFGIGRRINYHISVSAKPGVSAGESFADVFPPTGPLRPIEELPANIREAFEKARAEASRQG